MAYSSTTFGVNYPALLVQKVSPGPASAAGGGSIWAYTSTHTIAAVAASSFFSNGAMLGMKTADAVNVTEVTTAGAYTAHGVGRVTVVTAGAGATVVFAATST